MRGHDASEHRQGSNQSLAVGGIRQLGGAGLDVGDQWRQQGRSARITQGVQHLLAGPAQLDRLVGGTPGQFAVQAIQQQLDHRPRQRSVAKPGLAQGHGCSGHTFSNGVLQARVQGLRLDVPRQGS